MGSARSIIMAHASFPDKHWAEAVACAAYLLVSLPCTLMASLYCYYKTDEDMQELKQPLVSI